MKLRHSQGGQIMLILLGTLFIGGGATAGIYVSGKTIDSIRKDAKALQIETDRRNQVLELLDRWEAISEPAADDMEMYARELMGLITRRDATQADFQAVLERQRERFRHAEDRMLPIRDQMRTTLAKEEWDALFR